MNNTLSESQIGGPALEASLSHPTELFLDRFQRWLAGRQFAHLFWNRSDKTRFSMTVRSL